MRIFSKRLKCSKVTFLFTVFPMSIKYLLSHKTYTVRMDILIYEQWIDNKCDIQYMSTMIFIFALEHQCVTFLWWHKVGLIPNTMTCDWSVVTQQFLSLMGTDMGHVTHLSSCVSPFNITSCHWTWTDIFFLFILYRTWRVGKAWVCVKSYFICFDSQFQLKGNCVYDCLNFDTKIIYWHGTV